MRSLDWVSLSGLWSKLFFSAGSILKLVLFSSVKRASATLGLPPPLSNSIKNKHFSPLLWPGFQQKAWTWLLTWASHWEEVKGDGIGLFVSSERGQPLPNHLHWEWRSCWAPRENSSLDTGQAKTTDVHYISPHTQWSHTSLPWLLPPLYLQCSSTPHLVFWQMPM